MFTVVHLRVSIHLIGYSRGMDSAFLLELARRGRGLTQAQLAKVCGTSQATLSAYERGVKSPSLRVASRILAAADQELTLRARVDWVQHHPKGIVAFWVPAMLWSVPPPTCFATIRMPDLIHDSEKNSWSMRDRDERRGVYEQLIRRGLPQQMIRWVDGGLLLDLWDTLDLPDPVRKAWAPAIRSATRPLIVDGLDFFIWESASAGPGARIREYQPLPDPTSPRPSPAGLRP